MPLTNKQAYRLSDARIHLEHERIIIVAMRETLPNANSKRHPNPQADRLTLAIGHLRAADHQLRIAVDMWVAEVAPTPALTPDELVD